MICCAFCAWKIFVFSINLIKRNSDKSMTLTLYDIFTYQNCSSGQKRLWARHGKLTTDFNKLNRVQQTKSLLEPITELKWLLSITQHTLSVCVNGTNHYKYVIRDQFFFCSKWVDSILIFTRVLRVSNQKV